MESGTVQSIEGRPPGRSRRLAAAVVLALSVAVALGACSDGNDDNKTLGSSSAAANADIVIDSQRFVPDDLKMKVGEEVSFTVANKTNRDHTFTLPFLDIDVPVPAGQRATVTLKADEVPRDGFYSFYSKGKQVEGYTGRIEVES